MRTGRRAIVVVDLAFGDSGKGAIVDYLCRTSINPIVIRFNGGPQAGHNVVTPDRRQHTFSQFGSGSFVPGVKTFLSRFMLLEPYALLNEASHLEEVGVGDAFDRLLIDERCPIITPAHQAGNRLRELFRGDAAHGTCGMGVGELMSDLDRHRDLVLTANDLADRSTVRRKLHGIREVKRRELDSLIDGRSAPAEAQSSMRTLVDSSWVEVAVECYAEIAARTNILREEKVRSVLSEYDTSIFEGAQGVLLDEGFGFHPHTTWSTTTFSNADVLLNEAGHIGDRKKIGVFRTYFTRHGIGPFPTEDVSLIRVLSEPHNDHVGWQGRFRVGPFDAVAARYALDVVGPIDGLAITHMDRLSLLPNSICVAYRHLDRDVRLEVRRPPDLTYQETLTRKLRLCRPVFQQLKDRQPETFLTMLRAKLQTPVLITSDGPTASHKKLVEVL